MAPRIPALAQSESKSKLFLRMNLQEDDVGHKELYDAMKREAIEGRRRLIESESADNGTINETAIHGEILRIYDRASARTKAVYDLGRDRDGPEEENWIIRWMLWHAFRYRDQRNNRNRRAPSIAVSSTWEEDDDSPAASTDSKNGTGDTTDAERTTRYWWDPVRNQWRTH